MKRNLRASGREMLGVAAIIFRFPVKRYVLFLSLVMKPMGPMSLIGPIGHYRHKLQNSMNDMPLWAYIIYAQAFAL